MAVELIKDRLSRRQTDLAINSVSVAQNQVTAAITLQGKYLIQTLTSACGIQEIRTVAVQKLEMWLQNPKLAKPAQVCKILIFLRLTSKRKINQYLIANL